MSFSEDDGTNALSVATVVHKIVDWKAVSTHPHHYRLCAKFLRTEVRCGDGVRQTVCGVGRKWQASA